MAMIGEAFLGALLEVLLEKVVSGALAQIKKRVKGVKIEEETIGNLERGLKLVAAQLHDAEQQQQHRLQKSGVYKIWVEDLQDLAFDLEDLLDRLATDAYLQQLQQTDVHEDGGGSKGCNTTCFQSAKTKVKKIVACGSGAMQCFQDPSSENLPSQIENMSSRLEARHKQGRDTLGLSDQTVIQQVTHPSNSSRETTSFISERIIYGREEKKVEVIQKLLNLEEPSTENYDVISIVGIGGIGKTTLAQYVYNDPKLNDHFALKAWMCVSDDEFDLTRATTDIINSATGENLSFSNLNQSQHKLAQVLKDKRFLIVLDDVWTIRGNDWQQLQTPFLHGARGSKAIITTRKEETARMMSRTQTHNIFHLDRLSDDYCWELFKRHANLESDDDVGEMKSDIITKCGGLPLAAKALGGLFIKTVEKSQRQSLLNSGIWREEGEVLPVLRLSYFHLPSHLKQLFACCSIFPKDYEFEEKQVILFWTAQGMLPENTEDSMEVKGHHYFLELVSSSLFERSPSNDKCYVMHDLVHDLSQWAAGDLCRCITDTKALQRNCKRTRHLNLDINVANEVDQHMGVRHLRTFMSKPKNYIDNDSLQDFISRFESIRTLSLASLTITELPECIGDLKLLRCLDLRFPELRVLPKSIGKLCNLQTLFLDCCHNLRGSMDSRFLVKLLHMRLGLHSFGDGREDGVDDDIKRGVLEQLKPNSCIKECELQGYLGLTWPSWLGDSSFKNMVEIKLVKCYKCEQLPPLGQLPSLKKLWVEEMKSLGCFLDSTMEKFSCLEELVIKGCESFQGTLPPLLPCLKVLKIENCRQAKVSLPSSPKFEVLIVDSCEALLSSADMLAIHCSETMHLKNIKTGFTGLQVNGPCRQGLVIEKCDSLVSIERIPVAAEYVGILCCGKLERVEWEGASASSASNNNGVSIKISQCDSVVRVGNISLFVAKLDIRLCKSIEDVMFGGKWNLVEPSEATDGDNNGPPQLQLAQLVELSIWYCPKLMSLTKGVLMPSLQKLQLVASPKVYLNRMGITQGIQEWGLYRLNCLTITCIGLTEKPIQEWGLDLLTHLQSLELVLIRWGGDAVECIVGKDGTVDDTLSTTPSPSSSPSPSCSPLYLPSFSLRELTIYGEMDNTGSDQSRSFRDLKSINYSTFPNLAKLWIHKCPKLESLGPNNYLPPKLKHVLIEGSPLIKQQCTSDPNGLICFEDSGNRYSISNERHDHSN